MGEPHSTRSDVPELTLEQLETHPLPWARDRELLSDYLAMACRLSACYLADGQVTRADGFAHTAEVAAGLLAAWEQATGTSQSESV